MEPAVDLNTLLPITKTVTVFADTDKAEAIKIAPFLFGDFKEVVKHIVVIRAKVLGGPGDLDMLQLVADFGHEIGELIRIAAGKDAVWINSLVLTDVVKLAAAVLEVNRDFFTRNLGPVLKELSQRLSNGARS